MQACRSWMCYTSASQTSSSTQYVSPTSGSTISSQVQHKQISSMKALTPTISLTWPVLTPVLVKLFSASPMHGSATILDSALTTHSCACGVRKKTHAHVQLDGNDNNLSDVVATGNFKGGRKLSKPQHPRDNPTLDLKSDLVHSP